MPSPDNLKCWLTEEEEPFTAKVEEMFLAAVDPDKGVVLCYHGDTGTGTKLIITKSSQIFKYLVGFPTLKLFLSGT